VAALKRPFANDQLPVRGRCRMAQLIAGSALMVNLRRIHRYVSETIEKARLTTDPTEGAPTQPSPVVSFGAALRALISRRHWPWALGC
jgi:hypothetical protein